MNRYKNAGHRPVLDHAPGEEFDADLDATEEAELVRQGRIEILPRAYKVVGPRAVQGAKPGDQFEAAFSAETERILIEGGHIERAPAKKSTTKSKE